MGAHSASIFVLAFFLCPVHLRGLSTRSIRALYPHALSARSIRAVYPRGPSARSIRAVHPRGPSARSIRAVHPCASSVCCICVLGLHALSALLICGLSALKRILRQPLVLPSCFNRCLVFGSCSCYHQCPMHLTPLWTATMREKGTCLTCSTPTKWKVLAHCRQTWCLREARWYTISQGSIIELTCYRSLLHRQRRVESKSGQQLPPHLTVRHQRRPRQPLQRQAVIQAARAVRWLVLSGSPCSRCKYWRRDGARGYKGRGEGEGCEAQERKRTHQKVRASDQEWQREREADSPCGQLAWRTARADCSRGLLARSSRGLLARTARAELARTARADCSRGLLARTARADCSRGLLSPLRGLLARAALLADARSGLSLNRVKWSFAKQRQLLQMYDAFLEQPEPRNEIKFYAANYAEYGGCPQLLLMACLQV